MEHKYKNNSKKKGKTYEEMYGIQKAKEIKEKSRISHMGNLGYWKDKKRINMTGDKNPSKRLDVREKIRKRHSDHVYKKDIGIKISKGKKESYKIGKSIPYWLGKKRPDIGKKEENHPNWRGDLDIKEIEELYLEGKSPQEIAIITKSSGCAINRRLTMQGIKLRGKSESSKLKWRDPTYRKKMLTEENREKRLQGLLVRPTSYEQKICDLCIENNLPFVYTGDGRFWIAKKNPDFVDKINKIVIEVFHSYYKIKHYGSVENYINFCKEKYESYGWKVIFIDENEVDVNNWRELCLNKIKKVIL